jgi:hypothetical protein
MTSADVTSHQHSDLGIDHLSLFIIIMNHVTWAEFSSHEACINQDFPDHLTLQLSKPPMMVAFECHRQSVTIVCTLLARHCCCSFVIAPGSLNIDTYIFQIIIGIRFLFGLARLSAPNVESKIHLDRLA